MDVRKVAKLAHLEITDAEVEMYTPQMADIVKYVEQLNELDTENVEPAIGGLTPEGERTFTTREDVPVESLGQKAALDQAQAVLSENPNNGAALSVAAHALAHLGDEEGARELIERGLRVDPGNLNMRYNFGSALAVALNQPDEAFTHLEAALAKASGTLIRWVEIDPDVDSLRDDPRFQAMLAEAKARSAPKRGEPANA